MYVAFTCHIELWKQIASCAGTAVAKKLDSDPYYKKLSYR